MQAALGAPLDVEIIARSSWTAGYTLVAEKFRQGRIFMDGDAVHLFTPTGGLGYNTAVEDAVNLGWKLAAIVNGWGGPALLDSYEIERQAIARRNTGYARGFAQSIGGYIPPAELEDDGHSGEAARKAASDYLNAHARAEFNIPGVTFGRRYEGSPIVVPDGTTPPPDTANTYVPTACPGGRAPHMWLPDGRSLFDVLGFEFTLLRLGPRPVAADPFVDAAAELAIPLAAVDIASDEARSLYGADLALVRPDQIVAWRGNKLADPVTTLRRATGHLVKLPFPLFGFPDPSRVGWVRGAGVAAPWLAERGDRQSRAARGFHEKSGCRGLAPTENVERPVPAAWYFC